MDFTLSEAKNLFFRLISIDPKILRRSAPQNDREGKTASQNDREGKTASQNGREGKTASQNDREGKTAPQNDRGGKPLLRMTEREETRSSE